METLIIENNNPNQIGMLFLIIVAVVIVTNTVSFIMVVRKKKRLEKLLAQAKAYKKEGK